MKLLLIDDSRDIGSALSQALSATCITDLATTGQLGLNKALAGDYDTIILDLNLPDVSGLEVCQELRNRGVRVPIIILSAESRVLSKINLLDAGADDYLTKPFSLGELKVRLRVLQRRADQPTRRPKQLALDDLLLDTDRHAVERSGQVIKLRRKEFALLECLMQHAGMVVTRDTLCNYAWQDTEYPWKNTIDVHIKYLRDKIDRPFAKPLIKTVHGLGYKLEVNHSVVSGDRR